jgi:hypothetical protein
MEKDYKLPGPLPEGMGCNVPTPWIQNTQPLPKKNKVWAKTGIKKDAWEILNETTNEKKLVQDRDFSDKALHDLHVTHWVKHLKNASILKAFSGHIKNKKQLLSIKCVKNGDMTSRFIAYNKHQNRMNRISSPCQSTDHIIAELIRERPEEKGLDLYYCKMDFSKGFFNLPIPKKYWKYFCFEWEGVMWCFTKMIMGYSGSPGIFQSQIFTLITRPLMWSFKDVIIFQYLDDIICKGTKSDIRAVCRLYKNLCKDHNIKVNEKKSVLKPVKRIEALGLVLDLDEKTSIHIPERKQEKLMEAKLSVGEKEGLLETYKAFIHTDTAHTIRFTTFRWSRSGIDPKDYEILLDDAIERVLDSKPKTFKNYLFRLDTIKKTRYKLNYKRKLTSFDNYQSEGHITASLCKIMTFYHKRKFPDVEFDPDSHKNNIQICEDFLYTRSNNLHQKLQIASTELLSEARFGF